MAQLELKTLTRHDGTLAVTGELDCVSAPLLDDVLEPLGPPLRLDLTELTFIDSTGLHVLLRHQQRLDGALQIIDAADCVRRLFQLTGVASMLMPRDDVGQPVAS
jgi:anti-anti-sigma factor